MAGVKFEVSVLVYENGKRAPQYTIDTDLNGELTLESLFKFTKNTLIATAAEVLKNEQAKGFEKNPVVVVDNRVGKSVLEVSPLGKIEFVARSSMKEIVMETYKALLERSPVLEGIYKKSHYVFLNGNQVANDLPGLTAWINSNPDFKESDLIRFVNIQPYARKLETLGVTAGNERFSSRGVRIVKSRGNKGKEGVKYAAPNGAYFLTSRSIRRKYKRNSIIKFDFIPGASLGLTAKFKTSNSRNKNRPKRTYLYPTIIISVSEGGVK